MSSSSSAATVMDESFEDGCSICLEAFTSQDPATLTICKHEYHLQCILEWSQRSKECPICWRQLVLADPASQELLAAVEVERSVRSWNTSVTASAVSPQFHEDLYVEQNWFSDDSDFEEHMMGQAERAHDIHRNGQQRCGISSSEFLVFHSPTDAPSTQQNNTPLRAGSIPNSPVRMRPSVVNLGTSSSEVPFLVNGAAVSSSHFFKSRVLCRQPSPESPQDSSSSEISSFSDSIKSKWASVSARYKESISKSTQGFKEKLIARNNSVKELSKGVQREMSAGIAGVARIIEKLDLTTKRTRGSSSNVSMKGKTLRVNTFPQQIEEEVAHDRQLEASTALLH